MKAGTTQLKTDAGRTILQKRGIEYPMLAHKNWELWNFARTLDLPELEFLITNRKNSLKHEKDSDAIKNLRMEILLLEDVHHILRRRYKEGKALVQLPNKLEKSSIINYGCNILDILGFNNNTIYKDEVEYMTKCLFKNFKFRNYQLESNEKVATSIVKEVLDHYDSNYNEEALLAIHGIDTNSFYEGYIPLHFWCIDYYWQR